MLAKCVSVTVEQRTMAHGPQAGNHWDVLSTKSLQGLNAGVSTLLLSTSDCIKIFCETNAAEKGLGRMMQQKRGYEETVYW